MNARRFLFGSAALVAACAGMPSPSSGTAPPRLVAARTAQPPDLDGRGNDAAWRDALPVTVTAKGVMPDTRDTSTQVTLRAAYTETHLYLLATWKDATRNDAGHKTWRWDAAAKAYVEDSDREDMFAAAVEHSGEFVADMLAGVEATWDVWHWKAFRTNPQGYAMDKTHRYTKDQPTGKANKHTARSGGDIWIARPEDAGDSVEKKRAAPTVAEGERVPQYVPGTPSGSTADVRAKGVWTDGEWTLELARKLDTGQPDDTAFDPSRTYRMAVSVHDHTGEMDKATELITLGFQSALAQTVSFDDDEAGSLPHGWTAGVTGPGSPRWTVESDDTAPSPPHVLRQSGEGRFPWCVKTDAELADGYVEVRFKALEGQEDQAAGLVWRWKDSSTYYVARANALENNVSLYYTLEGKRNTLKYVDAPVALDQWHTLRVEFSGKKITVRLNGTPYITFEDDHLGEPGAVGVWTKADSVTSFDDFSYGPISTVPQ